MLAVVLTMGASVAACGDDGGSASSGSGDAGAVSLSGDDKEAADKVVASMSDDGSLGETVTEKQKECVGTRMVKEFGAAKALELADDGDLPPEDAGKAYDVLSACIDLKGMFAAEMAADGEMSEKSAKCLAGKLSDADFKAIMVAELSGVEDTDATGSLMAKMLSGMGDCLSKEELAKMTQ